MVFCTNWPLALITVLIIIIYETKYHIPVPQYPKQCKSAREHWSKVHVGVKSRYKLILWRKRESPMVTEIFAKEVNNSLTISINFYILICYAWFIIREIAKLFTPLYKKGKINHFLWKNEICTYWPLTLITDLIRQFWETQIGYSYSAQNYFQNHLFVCFSSKMPHAA